MEAPKFLCPTTGKECPAAQMAGEVLSGQILKLFRFASTKVDELGYLANLEMKIDRDSITNIPEPQDCFLLMHTNILISQTKNTNEL